MKIISLTTEQENSLFKHIRLEFQLHDRQHNLFENYGVVPNLGFFLDKVDQKFSPIVSRCTRGYSTKGTLEIEPNNDIFFNVLVINYSFSNNPSVPQKIICNLVSMERGALTVDLEINGSLFYISDSITPTLSHEILHGYEDYKRRRTTDGKVYLSDTLTDLYKVSTLIKNNPNNFNKETLLFADCVYWLSPQERRANLCRIEDEIKKVPRHIHNYEKAITVVSNTRTYKKYIDVKNSVELLNRKVDAYSKSISDNINDSFNGFSITPNEITQAIKSLEIQLKKFERKMETNVPKILYDIHQKVDIAIEH